VNVIDASSLVKYVLKEEGWTEVRKSLEEETVSVDNVLKEAANAIWRKAIVLKLEPVEVAWKRYEILQRLIKENIIRLEEELKYLDDAFRIALENNITVYDALYIAQALRLKVTLVTSDRKQAQVAKGLGVSVHYIP
jgi:predicted nucleic acid-binding protein